MVQWFMVTKIRNVSVEQLTAPLPIHKSQSYMICYKCIFSFMKNKFGREAHLLTVIYRCVPVPSQLLQPTSSCTHISTTTTVLFRVLILPPFLLLPFSGHDNNTGSLYWSRLLTTSSSPPGADTDDDDDRLTAHQLTQSFPGRQPARHSKRIPGWFHQLVHSYSDQTTSQLTLTSLH